MFENWDLILQALSKGLWTTVWITAASFVIALVIGGILATLHVSPAAPARWLAHGYTTMFRNTPLLAILLILYFGFPQIGISLPTLSLALIGLGAYTAAFVGETLRSGINSIPLGQAEAARSIGLTFGQSLQNVILPQAFRTVVPPLGSLLIALTKNSSLISAIGIVELTAYTKRLSDDPDQYINIWAITIGIAAAYLLINLPISYFVRHAEKRAAFAR